MAGTLQLADLVTLAKNTGAVVRLLGDPAQLTAVEAGGALRLLEAEVGAVHLDQLHRFDDPAEAAATLALRRGDPTAINFYQDNGRIRAGTDEAMLEAAYDAWTTDILTGHTSILIAATSADVTALNTRARAERITAGHVHNDPDQAVVLRDGNRASVGDWVVTRTNMRSLTWNRGRDWVKNGDTWTITTHHPDGSVTVTHRDQRSRGGRVRLPAAYVADSLELAYATTAHRVQGTTVDTAHALVTPQMTREALYVASTRGRTSTHWYATTEHLLDPTSHHEPEAPTTARDVLAAVLARTGDEDSATGTIRTTRKEAMSLPTLVTRYQHAWNHAALDALRTTAKTALTPEQASTLLNDPGAGQLARVLADATSRGANPTEVLTAAIDYDALTNVRSTALVLATRIRDYPTTLGIPRSEPPDRPLPWLPAPNTGHPDWDDYLDLRARLITDRATELGTLTESYREQYRLTHLPPGDIGAVPAHDGQQRTAHRVVLRALGRDQTHALVTPPASRTQSSRAATAPWASPPTNSRATPTRTL